MHTPFYIALRYFFTKSQQNIINLINLISLGVVLVATASLFIVLSAFSGLKDFGLSFSNAFDPDFRVEAVRGKILHIDSLQLNKIEDLPAIVAAAPILEEKVFLQFRDKDHVAYLKGVGSTYRQVVEVDSLMIRGNWIENDMDDVVIGAGIATRLSLGVYDFSDFLTLSTPRRINSGLLGQGPFVNETALVSGIFLASVENNKSYLFSSLSFAQRFLQRAENEYSSLEIKAAPSVISEELEAQLSPIFSQPITVKNRVALNAALYKMLNTENAAVYLIFTLVIIIALFNVVGSLVMMFLDKKPQLKILYTMGLSPKEIQLIFFYLGGLLSWVGGLLGVILGAVLVLIQQYFPFISVPGTSLAYPVTFTSANFFVVLFTLFVLGGIASFWATRNMDKKVKV